MKITFLGAVEEVTGSKYCIDHNGVHILVDCGLFQEDEELNKRNWEPCPKKLKDINALVLTHAHIDHTGYIPKLVKEGFEGPIYCSKGTFELCAILLRDSAKLFEQRAEHGDEHVVPLYTEADVERALAQFEVVNYDTDIDLGGSLTVRFISSHHIIGSAFVILSDGKTTLTFSGDLGRPDTLTMKTPPYIKKTDYLVLESTYGNRLHESGDPINELGSIIRETFAKGGKVIIPAFAVGRTQTLLYCLYQLKKDNAIPDMPIYLDSPLAIAATKMFCHFDDEYRFSKSVCKDAMSVATFTRTVAESKRLDDDRKPAIIIAGSGMANGGRVVHHFKHFIGDKKNTVIFVGYQARGTLGRELTEGEKTVSIHDKTFTVRAEIKQINLFSAHADYKEILAWLAHFESPIKTVFLTHGEVEAAQFLKQKIEDEFGWHVVLPKYLDSYDLD